MNRREEITLNVENVRKRIEGADVTLIAVTKTYPVSDVQILAELGVKDFGENRTEEGLEKSAVVPGRWHFQGGIQSRKLRDIAVWADVIHSLDNVGHATKLQSVSNRSIDVFIQLSLDGDPTRGGVPENKISELALGVMDLSHVNLIGLMCVLPLDVDPREGFTKVASIHRHFQGEFPEATYLSAGMSGDYEIAIDCGATHIRVGSQILGPRTQRG